MATITKGNPFTHHEETRESIAGWKVYGGCDWCGQAPRVLYNYDGNSHAWYASGHHGRRWFCNKGCWTSFYA